MFLENVFPPIPSELIMPLAGFLTATVYTRNYHLKTGTPVAKSCAKDAKGHEAVVKGYTYGALFITFNAGGDPHQAEGYFKTITGDIIDTFSMVKSQPLR